MGWDTWCKPFRTVQVSAALFKLFTKNCSLISKEREKNRQHTALRVLTKHDKNALQINCMKGVLEGKGTFTETNVRLIPRVWQIWDVHSSVDMYTSFLFSMRCVFFDNLSVFFFRLLQ